MFKKINWRYGIGEIIIVIIGITVVFSLNKISESLKNKNKKQNYLINIKLDLESEIEHLNENIVKFNSKIKSIKQIMPYLNGLKIGRDSIGMKVFMLAKTINLEPNDITYKTLINSGDLGLFEDFKLKKEIESYYTKLELLELDYSRQIKISENYFGPFMINELDYDAMKNGDFSFMDNKKLKNIVQSLYGTYYIAIESSKKGIERSEALISTIESKLKK